MSQLPKMLLGLLVVSVLAGCTGGDGGRESGGGFDATGVRVMGERTGDTGFSAVVSGRAQGTASGDVTIHAYAVQGGCPPQDVVPESWLSHELQVLGAFDGGSQAFSLTLTGDAPADATVSALAIFIDGEDRLVKWWCGKAL